MDKTQDRLIHNFIKRTIWPVWGRKAPFFIRGTLVFANLRACPSIRKSLRRELLFKHRWKSVTSRGETSNGTIDNKDYFSAQSSNVLLSCVEYEGRMPGFCQLCDRQMMTIAFKISSEDHHNILLRWWNEKNTTRSCKIRLDNTIARTWDKNATINIFKLILKKRVANK